MLHSRKIKQLAANVLLMLLTSALSFAAVETALRIYYQPPPTLGDPLHYKDWNRDYGHPPLIPGAKAVHFGAEVEVNSKGQRGPEYTVEKPENVFRIAIFGDSFTYGFGLPLEETFPVLLQRQLNETFDDSIEVINFGATALNTFEEFMYFCKHGTEVNPDLVLTVWYLNDVETRGYALDDLVHFVENDSLRIEQYQLGNRNGRMEMTAQTSDHPFQNLLEDNLYTYRHSLRILNQLAHSTPLLTVDPLETMYTDTTSPGYRLSFASLSQFKEKSCDIGAEYGVIIYPSLLELKKDDLNDGIYKKVADYCSNKEMPCLNLFPVFKGQKTSEMLTHHTDIHPSAQANSLAVPVMCEFVQPMIIQHMREHKPEVVSDEKNKQKKSEE